MLAKVMSCAITGLKAEPIEVEVDIINGSPFFQTVGLPDAAVRESRDRVHSAIKNSGLGFPTNKRITVNLAPADVRKEGPIYDLPIAVGILAATNQIWPDKLEDALVLGELALDGRVRRCRGVLLMSALAREMKFKRVFVPAENAEEAALIPDIEVIPVESLAQLTGHLTGMSQIKPQATMPIESEADTHYPTDFSDIKGQEHVKRAMEIAAAGGHNVLLTGPPGTGKTLIAKSFPSILPRMSIDEALEVTKIYSVAGELKGKKSLVGNRPFRAPHHTISYAGLVGGGTYPRPGEISLAHRGVLFLDELPEFSTKLIEVLRQPMEGTPREIAISRATGTITFPANFMLIAAQNPCPCGYFGDPKTACSCSNSMVSRYQKRISGPLLDRIDIHVDVPRVDFEKLTSIQAGETSATIRQRVEQARDRQRTRFAETHYLANADMGPAAVRNTCLLDPVGNKLIRTAMIQMNLSARAYHRILKLSRTIADLANEDNIGHVHVAEALQYRANSDAH